MADMRGTDVVVLGILVWLLWKEYNPTPLGACSPSSIPSLPEPQSSMTGPAWTHAAPPEK